MLRKAKIPLNKGPPWFEASFHKGIEVFEMTVERYPNLKKEVGGSIPGCEISSLLDKNLVRWSTVSYALALDCWPFVSKKKKKKESRKS
jgi:hypothetical protein